MKLSIGLLILTVLSTGCTKAVRVTEPTLPVATPITSLKVEFSSFYDPGTFIAEFDGQDVTQNFVPVGVAGGKSRMNFPDTPEGFVGGIQFNQSAPVSQFPVVIRGPDGREHKQKGVVFPTPAPPGSGSAGSGKARPNIPLYFHQFKVYGHCFGLVCSTTDSVTFFPIHLVGIPTRLNVKVGETVLAKVETYPAMSQDLTVQIEPSGNGVRLEGKLPGELITVVIPAGRPSEPFRVTGVASTNLLLYIKASGTQRGGISGSVIK